MRILIPTHEFTDNPNSGLLIEVWNITKELALRGHEITVITSNVRLLYATREELRIFGIKIIQYPGINSVGLDIYSSTMSWIIFFLQRLIFNVRYDWVFIIDNVKTPFTKYKLGSKVARRFFYPNDSYVLKLFHSKNWKYDQAHKIEIDNKSVLKVTILNRLFGLFAYTIFPFITKWDLEDQIGDINFCINKDTYNYYRLKIDNAVYLPDGVENARLDEINSFSKNDIFSILYIGKLGKRKGIQYLIKTFKILNKRHVNTHLWIIGSGSVELTQYFKHLSGSLLGKSIFFLGEVSRDCIGMYIKSCDVLIDPFIYAAFSNVVGEAMYCKKPVIAPKYGGANDFVIDGKCGFIVDARNQKVLYEKMEFLYNNQKLRETMGNEGKKVIIKKFTWPIIAKKIEDEFIKRI